MCFKILTFLQGNALIVLIIAKPYVPSNSVHLQIAEVLDADAYLMYSRGACSSTHSQSLLLTTWHAQTQDVLVQTYSGKVVAFSEEEVGSYQPSSAPASPLKRLTTQFSKVHESLPPAVHHPSCNTPYCHFIQYDSLLL